VMPEYRVARDYLRRHLVMRGPLLATAGRTADLHALVRELAAMTDDVNAQRSVARLWCRLWKLASASPGAGEPSTAACVQGAIEALQRAEALGWGVGLPFGDAVYAPLRGNADYEALVARITAKVGTGKPRER
jgi:hypothetical protein